MGREDDERTDRFVPQLSDPRQRICQRTERVAVRPLGVPNGVGERATLRVAPLEPIRGGVHGGRRHLPTHGHPVAVDEEIGDELGVRSPRVEVARVEHPRVRIEELYVRPHGQRVGDDREVAPPRRGPARNPPRERFRPRPVEPECRVEQRDALARPARARGEQARHLRGRAGRPEVLDRHEHHPRIGEVVVRERHRDTPAAKPYGRKPRSKFGAVQYVAGGPASGGSTPLRMVAAGMLSQCLRIVPYTSRKSVERKAFASCR